MIVFTCPECGERIAVDDAASGRATKCAACRAVVEVPADEEAGRRRERKRLGVDYLPDECPRSFTVAVEIVTFASLLVGPLAIVAVGLSGYGLSRYSRNTSWLWSSLIAAVVIGCVWSIVLVGLLNG
jgi:uncharacterized protein YlaI